MMRKPNGCPPPRTLLVAPACSDLARSTSAALKETGLAHLPGLLPELPTVATQLECRDQKLADAESLDRSGLFGWCLRGDGAGTCTAAYRLLRRWCGWRRARRLFR